MAVLLTLENKKAKPAGFKSKVKSTYASRTMRMSGVIFSFYHISYTLLYSANSAIYGI